MAARTKDAELGDGKSELGIRDVFKMIKRRLELPTVIHSLESACANFTGADFSSA